MPGRPLPETAKSRQRTEMNARAAREAAAVYRDESDSRSLRELSRDFGVSKDSIQRYYKNPDHKSRIEAARERSKLTSAEEKVVASEIELSALRAMPLTIKKIEQRINAIPRQKYGDEYEPCGKNFVDRFLDRN
jgi:DNA-binding transcriptional MocR family regulator